MLAIVGPSCARDSYAFPKPGARRGVTKGHRAKPDPWEPPGMIHVLVAMALAASAPDAQEALGLDLWKWRAETQPASYDDIPRVERPAGFTPDWSQAAIGRRRATLAELEKRWRALPARTDLPAEIDRRLLGSTLARVRWELDVTASWRRDPSFYLDQALCD